MMMSAVMLVSVARNLCSCWAVPTDCWAPAAPLFHWRVWCWCLPVTLVEQMAMECQQFVVDSAHLLEPVLALCCFPSFAVDTSFLILVGGRETSSAGPLLRVILLLEDIFSLDFPINSYIDSQRLTNSVLYNLLQVF